MYSVHKMPWWMAHKKHLHLASLHPFRKSSRAAIVESLSYCVCVCVDVLSEWESRQKPSITANTSKYVCYKKENVSLSTKYLGIVHKIPSGKMSSRSKRHAHTHSHLQTNKHRNPHPNVRRYSSFPPKSGCFVSTVATTVAIGTTTTTEAAITTECQGDSNGDMLTMLRWFVVSFSI